MLLAKLFTIVVLGQVPVGEVGRDPSTLVAQLGAARYPDREAADKALMQLGRLALPALRAARSSPDPEIRSRAIGLIKRIESALLTQPTHVTLDFEDATVLDVAKSFSQQLGAKVALYPEELPKWKQKRVTIRASGPVDFWKAVDRLCEAAGLQYFPNMNGYTPQREPEFVLSEGPMRTVTPNSDHGPFRVSLLGLHYQRDVNFTASGLALQFPRRPGNGAPPRRPSGPGSQLNPVTNVQFTAQLQVAGEPRLALSQNGPHQVQVLEAVDNRGNSLMPPSTDGPTFNRSAGFLGFTYGPVMQLQAHLHRPIGAGETIAKLRGVIPVMVSSRRPDPLVVPLAEATGKTFENLDVQLTVHDVRTRTNRSQTSLEFSVKANAGREPASDERDVNGFNRMLPRVDPQHLQIEIIDANGHLIPWYQTSFDTDTSHVVLTLANLTPAGTPKELRYYTLARATMSVPFEFADVPMP
jgi:hypothetical protein